jgi:lipoprotein LprG
MSMHSRGHLPVTRRALLGAAAATALLVRPGLPLAAQDDPDVADILAQSSTRLAEIESLHFTLDIDGETWIDDMRTIQLESAEGDLARPDKVSVEFKISLFGAGTVSIKMVTVGEDSWTTDLITGNWGDAPPEFGYNPSILYDNQNGLGPVMGKLDNAELVGTEDIDGRETWHIKGTTGSDVIDPLTAGTMTGDNVAIELWIATDTYDLLRVKVIEPENPDKDETATWVLNLSKFNEKITIEPPI